MRIRRQLIFCWISLLLSGCATAWKMNKVSLGMSKADVINAVGMPDDTKAIQNQEVLSYYWSATGTDNYVGRTTEYWIILKDGKVVQYGKAGDYGSSRNPALDLNIQNR